MEAGGKRFRPLLVLLAAETGDHPDSDDVVTAACVVELTHLASLYHDDVMDEADAAPRRRVGQRALGQPRRDPHRRLPVLEVLRADRRARPRRGPHPGADVHQAGRGPDPRDRAAGPGRGPARPLPRRGRRQDRLADRHLGAVRRPLRRRHPRGRGGADGVRRDRRLGVPALRRHPRHRLRHRSSPARPPAPTCARASRPCRC